MNNYDLLKLLGKIDRKYYDEALGSDPQKPLRIDVSRKPVKWYRIAAPIAACLLLGVGVIAISRFIGNGESKIPISSLPTESNSQPISSNSSAPTNESNSTPANESDPTSIDTNSFYELYPTFDPEKVPTVSSADNIPEKINASLVTLWASDTSEWCVTAETLFRLESEPDTIYAENAYLCLVEDGECVSQAEFPASQNQTSSPGKFAFSTDRETVLTRYPIVGNAIILAQLGDIGETCVFFCANDDKVTLLRGTDIVGNIGATITPPSGAVRIDGYSLKDDHREYRFDLDTLDNISADTPNYSTHFSSVTGKLSYNYWLYGEYTAGTEQVAREFRSYLNDLKKFSIAVKLLGVGTDIPLSEQQVSDVMDLIMTAKLTPLENTQRTSDLAEAVLIIDENDNCIASVDLHGNISLVYNDKSFFFDVEDDFRHKLFDAVGRTFVEDPTKLLNEGLTASGSVYGSEEDLQNWRDFINGAQVSEIKAIYNEDMILSIEMIKDVDGLINMLRTAELKVKDEPLDANGFRLYLFAYDKDGNNIFKTDCDSGVYSIDVLYEDGGMYYEFDPSSDTRFRDYLKAIIYNLERHNYPQ